MALDSKVPSVLLKVLENLNSEDVVKFQTHLVQGVRDDSPVVSKFELDRAVVKVMVGQMMQVYGEKDAVEICEIILKMINQNLLAQSLSKMKGYFSPEVPYEQVLPDGLKNQTLITIRGQVKHNVERFHINLCKGSDIAFHLNPRFNEDGKQVVVRNTWIGGVWGPEERDLPFFPFTPGKPFEIKILCTSSEFNVDVDNNHLLTYTHRITDLVQIRKLSIHDVFLTSVHVDPEPLWMTPVCTRCLDDVIYENMSLIIHGHVKPNAKVFTIDVMKDNDIFFHFKPCFGNDGRHMIKRNSLIGSEWGAEEADTPHFPFAQGRSFVVKIVCTNEEFKVDVNGSHLLDFKCRQPDITKINKVTILQDVIAVSVRVEP
ncbi:galectin-8-like [Pygocentrus nattereri]|uniref:galectin-8-like n=1 Tax=Pygocentrus nattereri TaxID=42514 RepID=UPI000814A350|nr:galectin-8-like [Pygocentrus nattereri]